MIRTRRRRDIVAVLTLTVAVVVLWCLIYNRLSWRAWSVPLGATSDSIPVLATAKAAAEGHFPLLIEKFNPDLGAPFVANWNDWPVTEELLFVAGGLLTHLMGLFAASNFLVMAAQILATLSFYVACRALRYQRAWSIVGSLAFGLSHYAFQRGLPHIVLSFYWHIPLCILVTWWCGSRRGMAIGTRRFWIAAAVAVATGLQNPYYTNAFIQLLGFATLSQLFRRNSWRRIITPLVLGSLAFGAFLLMNLDTVIYQLDHGKNNETAGRNYQSLELYGLKPVDLFVPPPYHRLAAARQLAFEYQHDDGRKAYVQGEMFAPYLGLAGIIGLLWMGISYAGSAIAARRTQTPVELAQTLWLLMYSVIGGVNGLIGFAGIMLFRCTNRYSIFILALALLFLVKRLTHLSRRWDWRVVAFGAALAVAVICWDQLPPRIDAASIAVTERAIASDRVFVQTMQRALKPNAMIFQLPVMRFPESWPINEMGDYEHLRPYLYSEHLHYSYGSDKGRLTDEWQARTERLPPAEMVAALERLGFSAIYINRKGYPDHGAELLNAMAAAGYHSVLESPMGDLVCVPLQPSADPVIPETPYQFTTGWYGEEGDAAHNTWRCSAGNANIVLINNSNVPRKFQINFQLASYSPRTVEVRAGTKVLYKSPGLTPHKLSDWFLFQAPPGETVLEFRTEPPVTFPNSPDTRVLGFILYNFNVVEQK
jgi:phosphoglycerol transferase